MNWHNVGKLEKNNETLTDTLTYTLEKSENVLRKKRHVQKGYKLKRCYYSIKVLFIC